MTMIKDLKDGDTFKYKKHTLRRINYDITDISYVCRVLDKPPSGEYYPLQLLDPNEMVIETLSD